MGAKKYDRIKNGVKYSIMMSIILSIFVALLFLLLSEFSSCGLLYCLLLNNFFIVI